MLSRPQSTETAYAVPALAPTRPPAVVTPLRRPGFPPRLGDDLIVAVATAEDVASGLARVVPMLRRAGGAARVEWWRLLDDGSAMRLETSDGSGSGSRTPFSLGPLGALVVVGDLMPRDLVEALEPLVAFVRRRGTEERLAERAAALAREIEAVRDFAALVAHDVKAPLLAILRGGDPALEATRALELVDSVLAAARPRTAGHCTVSDCLDDVLRDLGAIEARVVAGVSPALPMAAAALRLVLRNLVANAIAAGATDIRISGTDACGASTLTVDDDGIGLTDPSAYRTGSGLGLKLCEQVVVRCGGELRLEPRPSGGTRASLVFGGDR